MKYQDFLIILLGLKKYQEDLHELHEMGFNFFDGKHDLMSNIEKMFLTSFRLIYDDKGIDWINWFIYENEYGQKDWSKVPVYKDNKIILGDPVESYGAKDKDGNMIAYSYESLYELLEKEHKLK